LFRRLAVLQQSGFGFADGIEQWRARIPLNGERGFMNILVEPE
jgi:hypothetical protein